VPAGAKFCPNCAAQMTFQQPGQAGPTPSPPLGSGTSGPRGTRILMLVDFAVGTLVTILGLESFTSPVDPHSGALVWYASGAIFAILGLLLVASGYGLWKVRPWAWLLGLWAGVVYFALGVLSLPNPLFILVGIGSLLFYYLNRTDLKRYLGKVQS
jgi:hypothetical protein